MRLFDRLNYSERRVLLFMALGFGGREIARAMGIAYGTVLTYQQHIRTILHVRSSAEAVAAAWLSGFVKVAA